MATGEDKEAQWGTEWGEVVKAKLMFVGRLASMVGDKVISRIYGTRWKQVGDGGRRGVIGEVKEILGTYDGECARRLWGSVGKVGKGKFREMVIDFVKEMEERMWLEWKNEQSNKEKWYLAIKKELGREGYVLLDKRQRCLIAGFRLGVTNALGGKGKMGGTCRLRGEEEETGVHWVAECKVFENRRGKLVNGLNKGVEEVWIRMMELKTSEVISFLEYIDSVVYLKLSVRVVNFSDEVERGEDFLDELNLRADVWDRVEPLLR
jgi:hypothetical protein